MSSRIIGNTSQFIIQPGSTVSQSADGSAKANLTYTGTWQAISSGFPAPLQQHPYFPQLLMYEFQLTRLEGDLGSCACEYRGVLALDASLYAQYDYQLTQTSEPIETNVIFAYPRDSPPVSANDLADIQKALDQNVDYTSSNTWAQLLYNKKRRGIESYLRIGGTFQKSYIDSEIPVIPDSLGKIVSPPDPCPPATATGANYLYSGFSWRKSGGLVQISESYSQSGPSGWDPDLYGTT